MFLPRLLAVAGAWVFWLEHKGSAAGIKHDGIRFSSLLAREKLGSTALGDGIAIPHCRISGCSEAMGTLLTLEEPIDFDAPDGNPVDILFVLLVPAEAHQEHLTILGGLAQLLSNSDYCQGLRDASSNQELHRFPVEFRL